MEESFQDGHHADVRRWWEWSKMEATMKGFRVSADEAKELLALGEPVSFIDARTTIDLGRTRYQGEGGAPYPRE